MMVVIGLLGFGKLSFVFDMLYVEGQWCYVEIFSVYVWQFFDWMDCLQVECVDGVLFVIVIDQINLVCSLWLIVGMMIELNDYLKLLYVCVVELFDCKIVWQVWYDMLEMIYVEFVVCMQVDDLCVVVMFLVELLEVVFDEEIVQWLLVSGYMCVQVQCEVVLFIGLCKMFDVVVDCFCVQQVDKVWVVEVIEVLLKCGGGCVNVYVLVVEVENVMVELLIWCFFIGFYDFDSDLCYVEL